MSTRCSCPDAGLPPGFKFDHREICAFAVLLWYLKTHKNFSPGSKPRWACYGASAREVHRLVSSHNKTMSSYCNMYPEEHSGQNGNRCGNRSRPISDLNTFRDSGLKAVSATYSCRHRLSAGSKVVCPSDDQGSGAGNGSHGERAVWSLERQ